MRRGPIRGRDLRVERRGGGGVMFGDGFTLTDFAFASAFDFTDLDFEGVDFEAPPRRIGSDRGER